MITNSVNSARQTYGAVLPSSLIPSTGKGRPLTAADLNSSAWVVSPIPSHQDQMQGIKQLCFTDSKLYFSPTMGPVTEAMDQEMDWLADQYYEGKLSEDDLTAAFERLANDFLSACKENNYPVAMMANGMDEPALSTVYDHFRQRLLQSAVAHNQAEGSQYASENARDWKYYNAKYYYQSESAIEAITGKVQEMAGQRGLDQFEIPDYLALGMYSHYNFNSAVSGKSNAVPGGLSLVEDPWILDFDMVPPRDFEWFYQVENPKESAWWVDGDELEPRGLEAAVWVKFMDEAGKLFNVSRDFTFNSLYTSADLKNLGSLLQFSPASKKEFAAVNDILKKFQVYPPQYATHRLAKERWEARA